MFEVSKILARRLPIWDLPPLPNNILFLVFNMEPETKMTLPGNHYFFWDSTFVLLPPWDLVDPWDSWNPCHMSYALLISIKRSTWNLFE